jgi:hypothetical protein
MILFDIKHVALELGLCTKKGKKPTVFQEIKVILKFSWNMFVLCSLLISPLLILAFMIKKLEFIISLV